jgi:hypothetical protein
MSFQKSVKCLHVKTIFKSTLKIVKNGFQENVESFLSAFEMVINPEAK